MAREIDETLNRDKRQTGNGGTHGLKHRFREQINDPNGPPGSGVGDPNVWNTHYQAIKDQQKGLRDRLKEYEKNGCGDGGGTPIPSDVWQWATRSAPRPQEWVRPMVKASPPAPVADSGFMKKMSELTGLTGAALLIYVIVSEGSRLFPPRNLVPVP